MLKKIVKKLVIPENWVSSGLLQYMEKWVKNKLQKSKEAGLEALEAGFEA